MRTACVSDGLALQFCPYQDEEVALLACLQNGMALRFVEPELLKGGKGRNIVVAACARSARAFQFVESPWRDDASVACIAVAKDGEFPLQVRILPPFASNHLCKTIL